ncbi:hypothetical protein, partial [Vibrio parahaemolyticus]|uniref:hypothetical protein n=1 Tax=Vibrio parahaemolyticus TaxID=670 RepID=UPI001E55D78A
MKTMLNLNNILKIINLFFGHTKVKKSTLTQSYLLKAYNKTPPFISSKLNHQDTNKNPPPPPPP